MRDATRAAFLGVATVLAGAAMLYAIGHFLGWLAVLLIVVAGTADTVWCALQLQPWRAA
jgi:hypothetical protein